MHTDQFPAVRAPGAPRGVWLRRVATHGAAVVVGVLLAAAPAAPTTPVAPLAITPPVTVTAPPTTETVTAAPAPRAAAGQPAKTTKTPAPQAALKRATATTKPAAPRVAVEKATAYYANCAAAKRAGTAPLHRGGPGYRAGLDRDSDGVACEK